MASLIAVLRDEQGKFYQKGVDYRGRRALPFKVGQVVQVSKNNKAQFTVSEITQYTIVARVDGKQKRVGSFGAAQFNEAVAALQSADLISDFVQHAEPAVAPAEIPPAPAGTWAALQADWVDRLRLEVKKGNLRASSQKRYLRSFRDFTAFLTARGISNLVDITPKVFAAFTEHRMDAIAKRQKERGRESSGQGYIADIKSLNPVFASAVKDGLIVRNPIEYESAKDSEARGAQPFSTAEILAMAKPEVLNGDGLLFWVLLQTGLRRSDILDLRWSSVNGFITRTAIKNGKTVRIPVLPELKAALDAERTRRFGDADPKSYANEFVLLVPTTGKPFPANGQRVYERIKGLGERAGVANTHPHRFRDSFAADAFLRGLSTEEVAQYLGDDARTVAKHYSAFITERQDRADAKMLAGVGFLAGVSA